VAADAGDGERAVTRWSEGFGRALRIFTLLTFGGICCLVSIGVVNRFYPLGSMGWADEVIELLLVWTLFIGSAEIWRQGLHFRVDIVPNMLRGRIAGKVLDVLLLCASLIFLIAFTYQAWELTLQASDQSPIFSWSRRFWYAPMPIAGAIMCAITVADLFVRLRTPIQRGKS
jgi:TRAP-type C4-dicarboxylate transport system permease small subunit